MSLDPNKTYLEWKGTEFPNSTNAAFKAPAGSTIDWGDGTIETFDTASTTVNTHTYTDGNTKHTIVISGLTSIGSFAFRGCSSLMSVTIGNSVTSTGNTVFQSCINLTSVTIGNSVTSTGKWTFQNCTGLTSVTIGNSVTTIDDLAFAGCNKLKTLVLFPETPPTLASTDAIPKTTTIYVQQSSKEAYKTATNWTAFADKIESNDIYLSLIRFNRKNKEYIKTSISEAISKESLRLSGEDIDSVSLDVDDSNNLTVKATLKDGSTKVSSPVSIKNDTELSDSSTNAVENKVISEALKGKADRIVKTTMDEVAVANCRYYLGKQTQLSITLPDNAEVGCEISVVFYNGESACTLAIQGNILDFAYAPSVNTRSEINALWDGLYWSVIGYEQSIPVVEEVINA